MLNYAVIIQYLTQQLNIPNVRIAEWLNLDPSIISNIKNNKRKMQKDISYDVFYKSNMKKMLCHRNLRQNPLTVPLPMPLLLSRFITRYKTILSSDDRICLRKYALFYAVWELVSSTVSAV